MSNHKSFYRIWLSGIDMSQWAFQDHLARVLLTARRLGTSIRLVLIEC